MMGALSRRLRFLKRQKKAYSEKAKEHVKVSHRERVDSLNTKLANLTECVAFAVLRLFPWRPLGIPPSLPCSDCE